MPIKQLIASKLGQLGNTAGNLVKGAVRPVVNSFKKEAQDVRMGKVTKFK